MSPLHHGLAGSSVVSTLSGLAGYRRTSRSSFQLPHVTASCTVL